MKIIIRICTGLLLITTFAACSPREYDVLKESNNVPMEDRILFRSQDVLVAIQEKDMETFSDFVHPRKGVRFSPYASVNAESDIVLMPRQIEDLLEDETIYTWGAYDGSGEPIEMTAAAYLDAFVYDQDFAQAPEIDIDRRIGQGNTIHNIPEVYPGTHFIEYNFPGFDPQYDGMDWVSLRLVLEEQGGDWYLVGVVHDGWTI